MVIAYFSFTFNSSCIIHLLTISKRIIAKYKVAFIKSWIFRGTD